VKSSRSLPTVHAFNSAAFKDLQCDAVVQGPLDRFPRVVEQHAPVTNMRPQ